MINIQKKIQEKLGVKKEYIMEFYEEYLRIVLRNMDWLNTRFTNTSPYDYIY